ncbi:flagellar biosynthetic protein FliO [Leptospira ryugenii]|nr:flagellar biosynthetic protein FliO [Leptospira ryugenii]
MYLAVQLFLSSSVFAEGDVPSNKEMDQILRTELGVNGDKSTNTNSNTTNEEKNTNTNTGNETSNPIQERYMDTNEDSPSATWILLKILFVLAILVGAGYYLVQKMQISKASKYPVKGFMKVLSSLSLSPSQSVQIVEVGGKILVLGVAEGSINLISEITSPDEKNQINQMKSEADPYVPNFLETLLEGLQSKALSKKIRIDRKQIESPDFSVDAEIQRKARESVERLRKHRELLEGGSS